MAPTYNWTGFYVGGFLGGAIIGNDGYSSPTGDITTSSSNVSSFFGGGQAGYNWQFSSNLVLGIEGDVGSLSNNNRRFGDAFVGDLLSDRTDWLASVTGRLGYTTGQVLVYAKGGGAFRNGNGIAALNGAGPFPSDRDDRGYTVGGGLEYMFAPGWSAKMEYQYYDFDRTIVSDNVGNPTLTYSNSFHTVKAGINYHFN